MSTESNRAFWKLDPDALFLNHGSFGGAPEPVLRRQAELRTRMERQPVQFLDRELEALMDGARRNLAGLVGCESEDLVLVPNATTGVNTILRSLSLQPGDEILVSDHAYNACWNAVRVAAECAGARAVVVRVPFPIQGPEAVSERYLAAVTERTRLALVDHVTSPTALIFPVEALIRELESRNVPVLTDGAHVPGMIPLDIRALDPTYYTGNLHKWLCTPKGAAFLYVRKDRQPEVRPLVTSHGAGSTRTDRSRFQLEFGWTGTFDPTPYLCIPSAIEFLGSLRPGGLAEHMKANRDLAVAARRQILEALSVPEPCPESMLGSMASIPLPENLTPPPSAAARYDPLQTDLWERERIEVPVVPWPSYPHRLVRISAQAYNRIEQYDQLARALSARAAK